jgi:hypothetical protein
MRRHLTLANVLCSLALFLALGGGAWAAGVLPRNSVGNRQLRNSAVTGPKIAKNAVTSTKVKNGSLIREDFVAGALVGATGPMGPLGPKGDAGPGAQPAIDYQARDGIIPDGQSDPTTVSVPCPTGMNVLGGGAHIENDSPPGSQVLESAPDGRTGWKATGINFTGSGDKTFTVYATCVAASKTTP